MAVTNLLSQSSISDIGSVVANTPDLGSLLKHLYADWDIQSLVNLKTPLWSKIVKRGSAKLGGNGFYFPVRTRSAEGHAYIGETQDLPTAGISEVRQAVVQPKVQAGTVELTGLARAISSGNAAAFASAYDENVTATMESMLAYREGAMFRSGNGQLATVTSVTSGTPAGKTTLVLSDVGFLREGMKIEAATTAGARHGFGAAGTLASATIDQVDWAGATRNVIVDQLSAGANALVAADVIFLLDSQPDQAIPGTLALTSPEIEGLAASISSTPTVGSYLGLDRTTATGFANWRNSQLPVSGFLDEDALLRMRSRIAQESGITVQNMSADFAVVCHQTQVDIMFKLAIPKIRYSGNEKFDFGYSDTVYFGNIPFMTSYQCPTNTAFIGDWSYHKELIVPGGELGIDSDYNGASLKWLDRKDAGIVVIKGYHNLALQKPTCFGVFTALTDAIR